MARADSTLRSRRSGPICVVVAALFLSIGCSESPDPPLRVGLLIWPSYELPFLARSRGGLPAERVELVDFRSPSAVERAYRGGLIDAMAITGGFALELASTAGEDHRIVLVLDYSNGGDAIVARREVESLSGLAGVRVGTEGSILGLHMLHRALERTSLTIDDLQLVSVDTGEHSEAFLAGRVDAVVTYEPDVTRLLEAGAHVLFDSSEIPEQIVDVLVTRHSILVDRRDDLLLVARAWLDGQRALREEPTEVAPVLAARSRLDPAAFLRSLEGLRLVGLEENRRLLADGSELERTLRQLAVWARDRGVGIDEPDLGRLLDDTLVRELQPADGEE